MNRICDLSSITWTDPFKRWSYEWGCEHINIVVTIVVLLIILTIIAKIADEITKDRQHF